MPRITETDIRLTDEWLTEMATDPVKAFSSRTGNETRILAMTIKQLIEEQRKEREAVVPGADNGMCEICSFYERAMPVKPILDEQTGRIWLCGKCGSYVGFEDNDPHDPNEFDKYCRECGHPVLWEGR